MDLMSSKIFSKLQDAVRLCNPYLLPVASRRLHRQPDCHLQLKCHLLSALCTAKLEADAGDSLEVWGLQELQAVGSSSGSLLVHLGPVL